MKQWVSCGLVLLLAQFVSARQTQARPSSDTSITDLELQVQALTKIDDLDLSGAQNQDLQALANDTESRAPVAANAESKPDDEYREAMVTLRDALVSGDDEKIGDAQDKVDDLRDRLDLEEELEFPISNAARKKATQVVKLLSTSQLANYLSMYSDHIPDATDTIMDALDQCKDGSDSDYKSLRDEATEQVAYLAVGLDTASGSRTGREVGDLLDRARKLSSKQLARQRGEFERQAKEITKSIDTFDAMRHWMTREMAILLSNPQIKPALEQRAKTADNN